jgi:hypothetical protein
MTDKLPAAKPSPGKFAYPETFTFKGSATPAKAKPAASQPTFRQRVEQLLANLR